MRFFLPALLLFIYSCASMDYTPEDIPLTRDSLSALSIDSIDYKYAKIDSFFTAKSKRRGFNGAVLAAEKGKLIFKKAYGVADYNTKEPIKTSTSFQLASVSKPFTAAAVLILVEEGKLSLEDDVREFFPEFPYEDISIELLLIHRSGLPNYMYFTDKHWKNKREPIKNSEVIKLFEKYSPIYYYKPNVRYNYSNTGYMLLASIVEKVSGMRFGDFLKNKIFEPAGMKNSYLYNKNFNKVKSNSATGYYRWRRKAEDTYLNGVVGDKGVYSSVEDMLQFDRALRSNLLLSDSTLAKAYTAAHPELHVNDNYGFGWRINDADSTNKIVYHSGWWKGFRSYFIRQLGEQKTIIVLSNVSRNTPISTRELIQLF